MLGGTGGAGLRGRDVDWLWLAILCIMWAAVFVPVPRRGSPKTFPDLRQDMELRSDTSQPGRWVLAPKKGARFLGPHERARIRARERRRRVFVVMLEAITLTALIGLFPPLRAMLYVTGILAVLLLAYVGMVVRMMATRPARHAAVGAAAPPSVVVIPEAREQDRPLVGVGR